MESIASFVMIKCMDVWRGLNKKKEKKKNIVMCKVNKKILIHTTLLPWVEFFQRFNTLEGWNKNALGGKRIKN